MPIRRDTDPSNRLTTLTATGELTPEDFLRVVQAFEDNPPAKKILWDFRAAYPTESFDAEDMIRIASLVKKNIGSRVGSKTAYVANSDLVYGVSRMYRSHLEIQEVAYETNVFRTVDEAHQWLEEGDKLD